MNESFVIGLTGFTANTAAIKIVVSYSGEFIPNGTSLPICPCDNPEPGVATN